MTDQDRSFGTSSSETSTTPLTIIAVLLGGAVGTSLRLALDLALPHRATEFPLATLLINVLGSFLLAVLVARLWPVAPGWLRAGLGVGVLGSFTTFSAVAVAAVTLTEAGSGVLALGFLALSLIVALVAAALGLRLARHPTPIGVEE